MVFFSEHVDSLNVIGFATCQAGIVSYVCLRTGHEEGASSYEPISEVEGRAAGAEPDGAASNMAAHHRHEIMMSEFHDEYRAEQEGKDEEANPIFTIDDED